MSKEKILKLYNELGINMQRESINKAREQYVLVVTWESVFFKE
jgi:hypothetical protein